MQHPQLGAFLSRLTSSLWGAGEEQQVPFGVPCLVSPPCNQGHGALRGHLVYGPRGHQRSAGSLVPFLCGARLYIMATPVSWAPGNDGPME